MNSGRNKNILLKHLRGKHNGHRNTTKNQFRLNIYLSNKPLNIPFICASEKRKTSDRQCQKPGWIVLYLFCIRRNFFVSATSPSRVEKKESTTTGWKYQFFISNQNKKINKQKRNILMKLIKEMIRYVSCHGT